MKQLCISAAMFVAAILFSFTVLAAQNNAQDLVGMKAKNAGPQLQSRGFTMVRSEKTGKNNSYGMWWNSSSRQCLSVAYSHGDVVAITDSPESNCNQNQQNSSGNSGPAEWDRGCEDAKVGSYDRSHHTDAYEEGWQACNSQKTQPSGNSGPAEWDRGCEDAKVGSYDRSQHSDAYEEGWQACKNQQTQPSGNNDRSEWERGCSDAKVGSYDRSQHTDAYEEGWQDCNK